jgi:dihydroorotase
MIMEKITIIKPDDFHMHLRDGVALTRTVPDAARCFRRAIAMPNLNPPITTVAQAKAYEARIQAAVPNDIEFTPLMTLYLTDTTTPQLVREAKAAGIIGFKLYPANVTTHSEFGVTDIQKLMPVFQAMENVDLPLLIHGEISDPAVDVFDREAVFINNVLLLLTHQFPNLRMVFEHITTEEAVHFVESASDHIAATITAHHLWIDRNDLFAGGIHPHLYCLPIPKRKKHQAALIKAATSGNPRFFLGTDSALHVKPKKETACGCAGIYTSFSALPLYLEIFETAGALAKFEDFASKFGADFYKLPYNREKITLVKKSQRIPESLSVGSDTVFPFMAGEMVGWGLDA